MSGNRGDGMRAVKMTAMITVMLFFCGCGNTGNPVSEEKEIAQFSYHHAGSAADDVQSFVFLREEGGVRLSAEWNGGEEQLDVTVADAVMAELEEIVFARQMQNWDGFDKTSKTASDGDSFALHVTFADGTSISARGSNAFPKGYGAAKNDFLDVFWKQAELHADAVQKTDVNGTAAGLDGTMDTEKKGDAI